MEGDKDAAERQNGRARTSLDEWPAPYTSPAVRCGATCQPWPRTSTTRHRGWKRLGLDIAIGSRFASMLPMTDTENQVLGEASESAKDRLGSITGEGFEKGKTAAEKVLDAAAGATLVPSARDYHATAQAQEEHTE